MDLGDCDVCAIIQMHMHSALLVDPAAWSVAVLHRQADRIDSRLEPGQGVVELPLDRLVHSLWQLRIQTSNHQSHGKHPFRWGMPGRRVGHPVAPESGLVR